MLDLFVSTTGPQPQAWVAATDSVRIAHPAGQGAAATPAARPLDADLQTLSSTTQLTPLQVFTWRTPANRHALSVSAHPRTGQYSCVYLVSNSINNLMRCASPKQDGMWAALAGQLRSGYEAVPGAAQLLRLLTEPGLLCAASLHAALQQLGQQASAAASQINT